MNKFLITGCGKSGTLYISKVLTALGIPTRHETVFRAGALLAGDSIKWPLQYPGEVSWYPVPFLEKVLPRDTLVFHQIRHPLKVIRSMVRSGFWDYTHGDFYKLVYKHCPEMRKGTLIERSMAYWTYWNQTLINSDIPLFGYSIEKLSPVLLQDIAALIGKIVTIPECERSLKGVSKNTNSIGNKGKDSEITFHSLPRGKSFDDMCDVASYYNYDFCGE